MSNSALEHFLQQHQQLQDSLPNQLQAQHRSGIANLSEMGFPSTRMEAWKYTDPKQLLRQNFSHRTINEDTNAAAGTDNLRVPELAAHRILFVDGQFASLDPADEGLGDCILAPLSQAGEAEIQFASAHLNHYARAEKHGFAALNTAFLNEGTLLHVPDNRELQFPVHVVYLSTSGNSACITHPRNLLVLGKNARATVIETYVGEDDISYCTNSITEISAEDGAALQHYKLQEEGREAYHIAYIQAQLMRDARLESHSFSLGGSMVRNDIDAQLLKPGAHVGLNGLYVTKGSQHVDNHTLVDHISAHTSSDESYRGVMDDKSRAVFNGKVVVHKDAQKTDASQSNANLLLSDDAEIDTKPELEIYADDVKCSHGATVGQLDKNMLFYLRTRAIDEDTARSLLTFAFAEEVINRIDSAELRKHLETNVLGMLPDASMIREFVQ